MRVPDRKLEAWIRLARDAECIARGNSESLIVRKWGGYSWLAAAAAGILLTIGYRGLPIAFESERPRDNGVVQASLGGDVVFEACVDLTGQAVVLARSWHPDCDCLRWRIVAWADGALARPIHAGETVLVELNAQHDVAAVPAQERMLVFAVARDFGDLSQTTAEADALLECLNGNSDGVCIAPDTEICTSVVASCFPEPVTIRPELAWR